MINRRIEILSFLIFICTLAVCQVPQSTSAARNLKALEIVAKAIDAAGGNAALVSIKDYRATGQMAFQLDKIISAQVTLSARGNDMRLSAVLPDGERDWFILNNWGIKKEADDALSGMSTYQVLNLQAFAFPVLQLPKILTDSTIGVSYLGLQSRNGKQVIDIAVSGPVLGHVSSLDIKHYFFDAQTLLLSETEDVAFDRDRFSKEVRHQVRFSGYKRIQGALLPFQIADLFTDLSGNQPLAAMMFDSLTFNLGFDDSEFRP